MANFNIRTQLKGCSFQKRPSYLTWLRQNPDPPVWLEREPDCAYDPNAIRVMIRKPEPVCIGYLPRDLASVLAPLIDSGKTVTISRVIPTGGTPGKHQGCVADLSWDR